MPQAPREAGRGERRCSGGSAGAGPSSAAAQAEAEEGPAAAEEGSSERPLRIAVIFAGDCEAEHALPRLLRARGHEVIALDTKLGGWRHDVLRLDGGGWIVDAVASGWFDAVFLAPPCSSYSVRHPVKLRSRASPEGVAPLPPEWAAYVRKHNRLAELTARVIDAARRSRTPVGVENPADRGDELTGAAWDEKADYASIWRMPCVRDALQRCGAFPVTFAQCGRVRHPNGELLPLGSAAQKWTTVAASPWLAKELEPLADALCEHGEGGHDHRLEGRGPDGVPRATAAAAYPRGLAAFLAGALERAARAQRAVREAEWAAQPEAPQRSEGEDGRLGAGRRLGPTTREAIERARRLQSTFASARHAVPATAADLKREAFGGNVHARVRSSMPKSACKALRRRAMLQGSDRGERRPPRAPRLADVAAVAETPCEAALEGGGGSERAAEPATRARASAPPHLAAVWTALPGHIRARGGVEIAELFLPGVYETEVLGWFELADEAAAAIRAGEAPPAVPLRIIEQDRMPEWARGIVWDCEDPCDCRPVQRSTRHTLFPGEQQLDREAVRRVAALLDWDDADIIGQIGEGGVETRADCELVTSLVFHHDSLLQEVRRADESVQQHIAKEWVAAPVRHLPFVPCRMQPRGVVMQARSRLREDGTLEEYMKPRITTDASFGGADSVNASVPAGERSVILPSTQTLGRGWAICQSAFDGAPASDGGGTRVAGYCVDAESAYSFCPVQRADLWMQCFCWWGADGRAGAAVDRRMGFGGAFAPNRFERISTFVAAYAQHLQAQFDTEQPPPVCAQRWTHDRRRLQAEGLLPQGEEQLHPRFIQSFIDDFTGAAATDRVTPPPWLAEVTFEEQHMRAAGCVPAAHDSRVHVHAQLCVVALRRLGLVAAPHKIVCGSPMPALGLCFDGERRVIRCTETRRDIIVAACDAALEQAERLEVTRELAKRLTGRLCHLTQIDERIRRVLHAGYSLSEARWWARGRMRAPPTLRLAEGGRALNDWVALLETARRCVGENSGAAMAPSRIFPSADTPGSLVVVTDASGDDGLGGYAFLADAPHEAFVVSVEWPHDVRAALAASASTAQAALRRAGSTRAAATLPMPAAEMGGQMLVAALVAREVAQRGLRVRRVVAVGDCLPAARVLDTLHSPGGGHMRELAAAASEAPWRWLAVQVPREANVDADLLSHPSVAGAVVARAEAAGVECTWLEPDEGDWAALRQAISEGSAKAAHRRYKRRRRLGRADPSSAPAERGDQ